jgi:outer membrane protein assembly factor BamB
MGRPARALVLVLLALLPLYTGCAKSVRQKGMPTEGVRIKDNVFYHNISITYNGKHYFTLNGGNIDYCVINEYGTKGDFIRSYSLALDGRAIFYNPRDRQLYAKGYANDLYRLDLEKGEMEAEFNYIFFDENSSPAMSPDGSYYYEFVDGEIIILDAETGDEVESFFVDEYYQEHGYNVSIAASSDRFFVWAGEQEIVVYDLDGNRMGRLNLPRRGFSFSLSYCNNMLWIAEDADSKDGRGDGYWFGYRL